MNEAVDNGWVVSGRKTGDTAPGRDLDVGANRSDMLERLNQHKPSYEFLGLGRAALKHERSGKRWRSEPVGHLFLVGSVRTRFATPRGEAGSMRTIVAAIAAGLCFAGSAAAQMPAVPLATVEIFQRRCADIDTNAENFAWCSAYIVGYADAFTFILDALDRPPLCLNEATVEDFVDTVLRYVMPLGAPNDPIAPALQAALTTAMHC